MHTDALYQLGRFVVMFQRLEGAVTDLLVLMARADDEAVRILINELGFAQRLRTASTLFNRFVELHATEVILQKDSFSSLIAELGKLAERRNSLLHSDYSAWTNIEGASGLLRSNSRLRKGERFEEEETLLAEHLEPDIQRLAAAAKRMEEFRLYAIQLIYPDREA